MMEPKYPSFRITRDDRGHYECVVMGTRIVQQREDKTIELARELVDHARKIGLYVEA